MSRGSATGAGPECSIEYDALTQQSYWPVQMLPLEGRAKETHSGTMTLQLPSLNPSCHMIEVRRQQCDESRLPHHEKGR